MKSILTKKSIKAALSLISATALLLTLLTTASLPATAAEPVKVIVNGTEISFPDAKPFIDSNGRTQVPVRFVAEALGATVGWDPVAKRVDIGRGGISISMTIGVKEIVVLNVKKPMDTAPIILESRTFVPLRFVSEGFGSKVEWSAATRTVHITDTGKDSYTLGTFNLQIEEGDRVNTTTNGGIAITKKSGMVITEGGIKDGPPIMVIDIRVDRPSTDIPTQRKEAEAILKQRISSQVVDEIMEYIAVRKTDTDEIEMKTFKDGNYEILVSGFIFGPTSIRVYYRL